MQFIFRIILCLSFLLPQNVDAQNRKSITDGPYIFNKDENYLVKWIDRGRFRKFKIPVENDSIFKIDGLPEINLGDLGFHADSLFEFKDVERFAAISDVHGQYEVMRSLFLTHGIIDSLNNWNYGSGHLVILGDIFDRGDKVTECLWLIFKLEKQALEAGGRVHFLLGNHELMVLHGDRTYINPKYIFTGGRIGKDYSQLFAESTVLGKWLRSKKITVSINDYVFVHGGFSKKVLERESSLDKLNNLFTERILPDKDVGKTGNEFLKSLYFESGPLWYRGYAEPKNFDVDQAEYVLNKLKKECVVIGHTSMPQIYSLFANRIVLIDSSIKFGKTGEILLFENELLYRGKMNGQRILLKSDPANKESNAMFDYLADVTGDDLTIRLTTDFDSLLYYKMDEKYMDSAFEVYEGRELLYTMRTRVRSRGNMRKQLCEWPPLKIDFRKSELRSNGFSARDKVKLVLPCLEDPLKREYLYREYLVYQLYSVIDTLALRSKLIDLQIQDIDTLYRTPAFILEDEEVFAARHNAELIESGVIRPEALDRKSYLRLVFFQYLIANSDWDVSRRHNLYTLKLEREKRLIPVAYDFDYSGIVNQEFDPKAMAFPRMDMTQRKLRLNEIERDELNYIIQFYNNKQSELIELCRSADYLSEETRLMFENEIISFFRILNSRKQRNLHFPSLGK